jgi:prepilin-type N-terminal cleavage/methylation domain-containing protein
MKTKGNKLKGFTLIELLVVITIIGILATIVVVNLNTTRGRGQDVAVKEQMSQIRAASELFYDSNYGYTLSSLSAFTGKKADCSTSASWTSSYFADSDFQRSVAGIKRNSAKPVQCYMDSASSGAPSQSWMVVADLRLGDYWCVDSFGSSKEITTEPAFAAGDQKCP